MNFLLDTCALLHLAHEPTRLSKTVLGQLLDTDTFLYVSAITSAELACLQNRNRIQLKSHWKPWFREQTAKQGCNILDISLEILEEA